MSHGTETRASDRLRAMLPFDAHRSGITTGEGSAFLVLETEAHAGPGAPTCWPGCGATARCRTAIVTGLEGNTGHTGASAGAMNILAGIRATPEGRLPNVAGTTELDPEVRFDMVLHEPRRVDVEVLQVNAFGFGGQDASVVVARPWAAGSPAAASAPPGRGRLRPGAGCG